MTLWLYRDYSGWADGIYSLALARGMDVRLFSEPSEPDRGTVFARIHHCPDVRDRDKAVMAGLALNPDLVLIPGYRASVVYDDKAEQARQFSKWMPRTAISYTPEDAERALDLLGLPLMSKAADGAGSHNVRFVTTREQALREVEAAFGHGIPSHFGQVQRGYLLWQKFLAGNGNDFRVIAVGRERLILRRGNRPNRPMASGSGREKAVTWPDAEASEVLDFANQFFAEERQSLCGLDIVRDHEAGRWVVLESTSGWPLPKPGHHKTVSGRPWEEFFDIILDEIEAGAFA
jgi:hypothetical protein